MSINPALLDFANHHPDATQADIDFIASKVIAYGFNAAFVNPSWISYLQDTYPSLKIGTIISFPLGQDTLEIKLAAISAYASAGASELDTALNLSFIKEGRWDDSLEEMKQMVSQLKSLDPKKIIKFVPETGYLSSDELVHISELILSSGADFIKTNTGMGPTDARLPDISLIKGAIGDNIPIKVAGGISTTMLAQQFFDAGVSRIGTSHALEIIGQNNSSSTHQPSDSPTSHE